jgi:hypothetical protein
MEIQQQRNELEAEVGLKQALIERDAVYKRGGTQEEKDIADSKVKIAEVGYRGALYGRAQLEAEKVLMENEQRIREYEAAINARSAQDDINIERAGLRGRRRTRNLASEIRNRPEIPLPNITLPDIKIDETSITNLINKITTESKRETDRVSAEIDKRKKQLQDDLSKQTDSKRIKVETIDQKILQDQLRYLETINNTITNVGKSVVDKIGDKPKPTDKDDKPKPKDKEDKPTPKPTLIVPPKEKLGSVESAFNYVIEQMGTYEGVDLRGVKKPTLRFANTKDDKLLAAGAGGYYNDKTNDIVLREVFRKGLEKGDTGAFEILTHELRHWMQDEGFVRTKKNLDDPRLTKDGRAESESGIKFSTRNGGNRDREEDAYVYDEIYGNKILANYIYAQRNRYKEGGKNAPLKTGKTVISPGLFTPPMTPSKGNKSEPFPFGGRNWKDISIEEMQAYWRRMGYEDDKSPQLPGSRFGNRNPGSYLKPQIKPPSNEIPYGAIVNLRPQIKPPSNKIPYGAMVNWGSGILDQLKNNPDNRLFYERYKQNVKDNNLQAGINPRVRANYNDSTNPSSMKGYEYYAERLERSLNKGEITNDMADRMWQDVVVKGGLTNKSRREVYAQNQEKYGKSYAEQEKENKNNTVNFTPNITINVATKDCEVGETIKSQLNDQLYNIFNETIRQLG